MSAVSIAVPVYHNAASLPDLLGELRALADRHAEHEFEFVFVDDGSQDGSFDVLRSLAAADPRVRAVRLSRNFGSNAAILAGLSCARGDLVGVIAADLQDPPEVFDEMLRLARSGHKVVIAARRRREDPFPARLLADAFYRLFRWLAIPSMPHRGFDFFLIDRQVVDLINGIQENNAYLMGLILWLGFQPALVEYDRRRREERYGRSMWTLPRKLKYFADAFVAFSNVPVRAASLLGLLLSAAGLCYGVVIVFLRLVHGFPVTGWTSLMVAVVVMGGIQMMILGVLGEYLWRTLDETRRRPRFIIDDVGWRPAKAADAPPEAR